MTNSDKKVNEAGVSLGSGASEFFKKRDPELEKLKAERSALIAKQQASHEKKQSDTKAIKKTVGAATTNPVDHPTGKLRTMIQNKTLAHSFLQARHEKAYQSQDHDAAKKLEGHIKANWAHLSSLKDEFGKRNTNWRASEHAKLTSGDNVREPSSSYSGTIAMTEPKKPKTEKQHIKSIFAKLPQKNNEENDMTDDVENQEIEQEVEQTVDTNEPEEVVVELSPYQNMVKAVFDETPQAFVDQFSQLIQQRVSELVADRKLALQTSLFGAPEGLEEPEAQEEPTPEVSEDPPVEDSDENKEAE